MSVTPPEELTIIEFKDVEEEDDHMHCSNCYPHDPGQIVITFCGQLSRDEGTITKNVTCVECEENKKCKTCGTDFR